MVNSSSPTNVTLAGTVNASAVLDAYASYTLSVGGGARCLQCAVTALQAVDSALDGVALSANAAAAFARAVPAATTIAVGVLNNTLLPQINTTISAATASFDATRKQLSAGAVENAIYNFASFQYRASLQSMQQLVSNVTIALENSQVCA